MLPNTVSLVGQFSNQTSPNALPLLAQTTQFSLRGPDRRRRTATTIPASARPIPAPTTGKRKWHNTHARAVTTAAAEQQLVDLFELAIQDQPDDVPSFISAQSITGTWFPTDNPAAAPTLSQIPWARMPPVPSESLPQWAETQAATKAGMPTQTHGLARSQAHLHRAAQGRALFSGFKPKTATQRAALIPLQAVQSRGDYMAAIRSRFIFVLDKSRKAGTMNQQAFHFEWWTQHCLTIGTSPFRWRWARRHLMSGTDIAEEEGLLTTFCVACSIRWSSFDMISQALSHVFTFHERYMLCPRPTPMPILTRWLDDCRRQMNREMGLPKVRDALLPREVNTALRQVVDSWHLPPVQQFLTHNPREFTLTRDITAGRWVFTPLHSSSIDGLTTVKHLTPASMALEMAMALGMSLGSQFAFRMGNLAVGTAFNPSLNWSANEVVKMAHLANAEPGATLILSKPTTKTSTNSSKRSRQLAAEPIPLMYDPNVPGHPVALAVMINWIYLSHLSPTAINAMPAIANYRSGHAVSLDDYNSWQAITVQRFLPDWAAVLTLTQYSLRIGAATAWTIAGAKPEELDHLGSWASAIGREVYSRMAVQRRVELQQAAALAQGTTLDSLLNVASSTTNTTSAVYVSSTSAKNPGPQQHVRSQREQQRGQRDMSSFMTSTRQSAANASLSTVTATAVPDISASAAWSPADQQQHDSRLASAAARSAHQLRKKLSKY